MACGQRCETAIQEMSSVMQPIAILRRLDQIGETISNHPDALCAAMDQLLRYLCSLRKRLPSAEWRGIAQGISQSHIARVCREDPFTQRGFEKPRGYPGDAGLMDFLYRHPTAVSALATASHTTTGLGIHNYKISCPSGDSVRWRADFFAGQIDRVACQASDASVLSIASGFFREGEKSIAVASRSVQVSLLDSDRDSLTRAEAHSPNIETHHKSIRAVVSRKSGIKGKFDLIYAAGLLDYLSDSYARALVSALVAMLKPKGRLIIANFLPGNAERGYMEAIMDWWLIYRTKDEMVRLVPETVPTSAVRLFTDPIRYVAYVEITHGS